MLAVLLAFFILLGVGLHGGEVNGKEAMSYVGFLLICVALIWFCKPDLWGVWLAVPTLILDAMLALKIFGYDPEVRHRFPFH